MLEVILQCDRAILDFLQTYLRCDFLDALIPRITALGNGGAIWIFIAAAFLIFPKYRKQGICILVGLLVGLLLGNLMLKPLVARSRPNWDNPTFLLLIQNPTDFSFPSGHTLSSFIAAFVMFMHNKKVGGIAILGACLIAFSRLYLYVHYPSDILGAILLSVPISILVYKLFYRKRT